MRPCPRASMWSLVGLRYLCCHVNFCVIGRLQALSMFVWPGFVAMLSRFPLQSSIGTPRKQSAGATRRVLGQHLLFLFSTRREAIPWKCFKFLPFHRFKHSVSCTERKPVHAEKVPVLDLWRLTRAQGFNWGTTSRSFCQSRPMELWQAFLVADSTSCCIAACLHSQLCLRRQSQATKAFGLSVWSLGQQELTTRGTSGRHLLSQFLGFLFLACDHCRLSFEK